MFVAGILRFKGFKGEKMKKSDLKTGMLVELVKELQGELGGNYSIYQNDVGNYRCRTGWADIGAVTMLELTADKICEMLNNEEYKLDV